MWLRRLFGCPISDRSALESAFDPVVSPNNQTHSRPRGGYAAPRRSQIGGAPTKRTGLSARLLQSGIVPILGGKVP
ncbi:hypothetical protein CKY51_19880 [Xanthomonas maliensis]|nr:hypothetical protein CKY51_19880 [Xanthomonas maliensis]